MIWVRISGTGTDLEPISYIGTCATEAMWDAGLGGSPAAICRYCKGDRQQDAPRSPRPFGLRPGRSAALLPSLTISTYGLRRAPRIRSVLATTHHAPIIEIGSYSSFRLAPGRACRRVRPATRRSNYRLDFPSFFVPRWVEKFPGALRSFHG